MALTNFTVYGSGVTITSADLNAVRTAVNNLERAEFQSAQNVSGGEIKAGQLVAMHSSGVGFILADKGAIGTRAIGVAMETVANGFALVAQVGGILSLDDWTDATGASSLAALTRLYLGDDGALTATPTETGGEILQLIGEPVGAQKLAINIAEPMRRV